MLTESTPRSRCRHWLKPLAMLLVFAFAPFAWSQGGPPPEVRAAVDATMAMLGSDGDAALETYVDDAMTGIAPADRSVQIADLRDLRQAVRGFDDRVAVEAEDDGVRIELSGASGTQAVRLLISPAGVTQISLVAGSAPSPGEEAGANETRDARIREHIRSIEQAGDWDTAAEQAFARQHLTQALVDSMSPDELHDLLASISTAAREAGGSIVSDDGDVVELTLSGAAEHKVRFTVAPAPPFCISAIEVVEVVAAEPIPDITRENLTQVLDGLEARGLNGVVSVKVNGEMLYLHAFGHANSGLGTPMQLDSIFGTGSAPIDYTIAGILKLKEQGQLSLDDPVTKYFADVPADRAAMRLRDILDDRSGLPDFLDRPGDWDLDLAWISRDEAVHRILSGPLLFAPGTQREHSHAGYGLLAAVIEVVSGEDYYAFLKRNFFDPAGMTRTGMYGDAGGHALHEFAEGGGPDHVGLPNIPPNWGPTSWLVMGSGGMYSSLDDLDRFRAYITTGGGLSAEDALRFLGRGASLDGSDRGFEMFRSYNGRDSLITFIMTNQDQDGYYHQLFRALDAFLDTETQ